MGFGLGLGLGVAEEKEEEEKRRGGRESVYYRCGTTQHNNTNIWFNAKVDSGYEIGDVFV